MPRGMVVHDFTRRVRTGSRSVDAIVADLARSFDVSTQAMEIRLKVVGALAPF